MVKRESVSVVWQIVLSLLVPFYFIYALYRIQKLRLGLVIFAGGLFLTIAIIGLASSDAYESGFISWSIYIGFGIQVSLVVLLTKWSINWNKTMKN